MGEVLVRWFLIFIISICIAIPLATVAVAVVVKPVYWQTWLIAFMLVAPPLVLAYLLNKKLTKQ